MSSEHIIEVTDDSFEQVVVSSKLPALVDFWGPQCGPCKALDPLIEKLASSYEGQIKVAKVDVGSCPQTAIQYSVKSLPTILMFKQGKVVDQFTGRPSPAALEDFIKKAL